MATRRGRGERVAADARVRILGGLVALSSPSPVVRYRRRQVSRLNLIITCALCIVVVALSISPSFFDPVFRTFNFQPPNNQPDAEARTRLIFVLVVAVVILFALYLRLQSSADTNERAIRLLVEALGQERFDWERAASLPDGPRLVTVSPAFNEAENVGGGDQGDAEDGGGLPGGAGGRLRRLR